MKNVIFYLIGFPGTGKRTIALEMMNTSSFILIDSHYINNVILNLIGPSNEISASSKAWDMIDEVRLIIHKTIREITDPDSNIIFTNNLWENCSKSEKHYQVVAETARIRKSKLVPVRLSISEESLVKRVSSIERSKLHKLSDVNKVINESREQTIYKPKTEKYLDIECSGLSASQSAALIMERYNLIKNTI